MNCLSASCQSVHPSLSKTLSLCFQCPYVLCVALNTWMIDSESVWLPSPQTNHLYDHVLPIYYYCSVHVVYKLSLLSLVLLSHMQKYSRQMEIFERIFRVYFVIIIIIVCFTVIWPHVSCDMAMTPWPPFPSLLYRNHSSHHVFIDWFSMTWRYPTLWLVSDPPLFPLFSLSLHFLHLHPSFVFILLLRASSIRLSTLFSPSPS